MLVYCSRIFLVPQYPLADFLDVAAHWLSHKTGRRLTSSALQSDGRIELPNNTSVEWLNAVDDSTARFGFEFKHPDSDGERRTWSTELGVHRGPDQFFCTVLLRTEESSALVGTVVQTTRPRLVKDIFDRCKVSSNTVGGSAKALRVDDAESFLYEVNLADRAHPIVLVSHARDGREVVSPKYLAALMAGVATVAFIPPEEDTFELESVLSRRLCCFDGAVNIIWPRVRTATGTVAPNYRILSHDILAWRAKGLSPESELLATVCHRMNETFARDHLTVENVRAMKHRIALDAVRGEVKKHDADTVSLYKRVDEDQTKEITALKENLRQQDKIIAAMRAELQQERSATDSLKHNLDSLAMTSANSSGLSDEFKRSVVAAATDNLTLLDALTVLTNLYPQRLIVLDSAWKSARDADKFKYPRKAFDLLHRLCTSYFDSLASGRGDMEARSCFGNNAFSAKESETVEGNKKAKQLRTFIYEGQPIEMMTHVKIGVKPSVAETFRAHFHWDVSRQRIVLGHCGRHLDHS
jgi:hypothetical protein